MREGMSVCHRKRTENTLQRDGTRIAERVTTTNSGEGCEFGQVYSSLHLIILTSHDQFTRLIILLELECIDTKSNGSQFRQVYSSFHFQTIHPQTPHENTSGMQNYQTEGISSWASLFVISFSHTHPSIPMKHTRS